MNSFQELIHIDKNSNIPLYSQIMNAVITNIRRGYLRRGLKLPGSRELAVLIGIHRKTLQNALDELVAQGWLEIIPRKGTFVAKDLPEINPVRISSFKKIGPYPERTLYPIDEKEIVTFPLYNPYDSSKLILDEGLPDIRTAPIKTLMKEYKSLSELSAFKKYFGYGNAQGSAHLINALTSFLCNTRGFNISNKNVLITKGAQMGIYLTAKLLIKKNDNIIVGEPGYFISNLTFRQNGAVINQVPVDDYGINVDYIERLCQTKKIRLIYIIPHHHFPTTVTLIPERRIKLLELAAKYKFAVIEDDYDYDFHYSSSPILPMASIDHLGSVIYIGTLTKTFVPAVRIGFVIAPENFINASSYLRRAVDWQGDHLMEVAVAQLFKNGTIERHIKKTVKLYKERRDYFCKNLKEKIGDKISFKIPDGGMSVWVKFNNVDLKIVAERAFRLGLIMSDGREYNTSSINYNSARFGFASLNMNEIDKVIDIINKSII